jgi:hypothetical protein
VAGRRGAAGLNRAAGVQLALRRCGAAATALLGVRNLTATMLRGSLSLQSACAAQRAERLRGDSASVSGAGSTSATAVAVFVRENLPEHQRATAVRRRGMAEFGPADCLHCTRQDQPAVELQ